MNPPDTPAPPAKKAYHPPTLRRLGTVQELTGTPGTFQQIEPISNNPTKTHP